MGRNVSRVPFAEAAVDRHKPVLKLSLLTVLRVGAAAAPLQVRFVVRPSKGSYLWLISLSYSYSERFRYVLWYQLSRPTLRQNHAR